MHADYIRPYEQPAAVLVETGVIFTESTLLGRTKYLSEQLNQRFCQLRAPGGSWLHRKVAGTHQ